jgi:hypothetical protein
MPRGRTPEVIAAKQAERTERQSVKALRQDIQTEIDGITPATTIVDLRRVAKETLRILRRTIALL